MSNINVQLMSKSAVEALRNNSEQVTKKLEENPGGGQWVQHWLKGFIDEEIFEIKKYVIEDFTLEIPKNENDKVTDINNSILLYEHLKDLPAHILYDERFWCWINFMKGYAAALKYMPLSSGKKVFKDHWLFSYGNRRSLAFGVLSRCFLRVFLTVDNALTDPYEYSRFAIEKPDRFRNLSWRTISSEKKLVLGALKAEKRILNDYSVEETGKYYAEVAKEISKLGSVMLLDIMSEADIESYVYSKIKKKVEQKQRLSAKDMQLLLIDG